MKVILLPFLIGLTTFSYGQSVIQSVNSGALSNDNLSYTVGEIYVNPVSDADETNSGLMGIVSNIEFIVGIDDQLLSIDVRVLPNPVSNILTFQTSLPLIIRDVNVYDSNGKLAYSGTVVNDQVDLSGLIKGVYFIATNVENMQSLKIVKQ